LYGIIYNEAMQSTATTVDEYLAEQTDERRAALEAVRRVILANLPSGYEEGIQYGMIGYFVPLERYRPRNGQALPYMNLTSQKNYMALYLTAGCHDAGALAWFQDEYKQTGKKLDMGKGCVRFRKLEDLPLELIGKVAAMWSVDELIEHFEGK
jgi:uncharacterized protein YdhG (YjbR/CyaY superfamily)